MPDPVEEARLEMDRAFRELQSYQRDHKVSAKKHQRNAAIRAAAIEIGELAPNVEYWIVENTVTEDIRQMRAAEKAGKLPPGFMSGMSSLTEMEGALNGYVAFPKRRAPFKGRAQDTRSILTYIPVHGGINYSVKDQTACVYGFDTCHPDSGHFPRGDRRWIEWQCRVMYEGLLKAAPLEQAYLRAKTNERRAEIVQALMDMVPEQELNFGVMINLLSGQL